jgi:hypothetical protein
MFGAMPFRSVKEAQPLCPSGSMHDVLGFALLGMGMLNVGTWVSDSRPDSPAPCRCCPRPTASSSLPTSIRLRS